MAADFASPTSRAASSVASWRNGDFINVGANAQKPNLPSGFLPDEPSLRLWFRAPVGIWGLAQLWFAISVAITACSPPAPTNEAQILLFAGTGTSPYDVAAVESVLKDGRFSYATVNSRQLNWMSEAQLKAYQLLIVPGGNFIRIGQGLTSKTTSNLHNAVQGGLNYLGICAGGFLAGHGAYKCLDLTSGVRFGFYSAENRGIRKAAVAVTCAGVPTLEHYWEDGPQFTGWGAVVGKYPDGTPAIVEGMCGRGWVILSGVHPEAPANWRRGMNFTTSAESDQAYAGKLIDAALHGASLAHY